MYVVPISAQAELVLLPVRAAEEVTALVQRNQDRLACWEDWVTGPLSVERSRQWLQDRLDDFAAGTRIGTYLRVDGVLVGSVALSISGHRGEIGYWLDAAHEGRGLATAASRALLDIGFAQRQLERIELRTSALNTRSRALATRLGFRYEGTLRHAIALPAGGFHDEVIYGLLRTEWGGSSQ
jgi:ribosomal-protein-serine acetyltransferase